MGITEDERNIFQGNQKCFSTKGLERAGLGEGQPARRLSGLSTHIDNLFSEILDELLPALDDLPHKISANAETKER